jgi:hypothetical protein
MGIKDYLHLYLGCEMMYEGEISTLESVSSSGLVGDENRDESGEGWYDVSDIKPILRPLSDMTDEEAKVMQPMFAKYHKDGKQGIEFCAKITTYALQKHFDLFGLIDAGLAIDKNKQP